MLLDVIIWLSWDFSMAVYYPSEWDLRLLRKVTSLPIFPLLFPLFGLYFIADDRSSLGEEESQVEE